MKIVSRAQPGLCVHGERMDLPHDCTYVEARNACIPEAEERARSKTYGRNWARIFLAEMTAVWEERQLSGTAPRASASSYPSTVSKTPVLLRRLRPVPTAIR